MVYVGNTDGKCFCKKPVFVEDSTRGEIVCSTCGTVMHGSLETAQFAVGTTGNTRGLKYDKYIPSTKMKGSSKMSRAESMANQTDKTGLTTINIINTCCARLGLPRAVNERSMRIFVKFRRLLRGGVDKSSFAASVLYIACREHSIPRSLNDICKIMNTDLHLARSVYKRLYAEYGVNLPIPTADGIITRIASDLKLPEKVTRSALATLKLLNKNGLTAGRKPTVLATYAIQKATIKYDIGVLKKPVARAAGVSQQGVNKIADIDPDALTDDKYTKRRQKRRKRQT